MLLLLLLGDVERLGRGLLELEVELQLRHMARPRLLKLQDRLNNLSLQRLERLGFTFRRCLLCLLCLLRQQRLEDRLKGLRSGPWAGRRQHWLKLKLLLLLLLLLLLEVEDRAAGGVEGLLSGGVEGLAKRAELLEDGSRLELDRGGVELCDEGALDPERLGVAGEAEAEALGHLHARLGARAVLLGVAAAAADAGDLEGLEGLVDAAGVEDARELCARHREQAAAGHAQPDLLCGVAVLEGLKDSDLLAWLCNEAHALLPLHLLCGASGGHHRTHLERVHLHHVEDRPLACREVC